MEHSMQTSKPKYAGTQGTLLVAKNDDRLSDPIEEGSGQPINLDQPALIGLTPPFSGRRFPLRPGKTAIGRREDNDIVLTDGSVSSLHAWVIEDNGNYRIMNILSTNGSFVNNERITEAPLKDGDRIRFGGVELQLYTGLATQKRRPTSRFMLAAVVIGLGALVALGLWFILK
ncbi:MAG: FHA domain-containing protein [Halothiobacillus sp.]